MGSARPALDHQRPHARAATAPLRALLGVVSAQHPECAGPPVSPVLRRHLPRGFTLIWDRNRPKRAQRVQAWLAWQRRIVIEWLPPYAPELNPVEHVLGHTKYGDLANHTPEGLAELAEAVEGSLTATSTEQSLLEGFVRATGLAQ